MASLKRYKQPSENCINRFQDIPPRFKRQKSFTSSKPLSAMETENQNSSSFQKNKKATWGDSFTSNWSSNSNQKGSPFPREGRKIVKKLATQKAQINAEKTLLKPSPQPFVLSPMENKLFNLMRNDEHQEPHFAGTVNQSYSNADQMLGLHTLPTMSQQTVPVSDSLSKDYQAAGQNESNSNVWFKENPGTSMFKPQKQQQLSPKCSSEQQVDYSDPDIRTIEMLRELERVADETDVGTDNSNDKNSLVSHHLRMLMCAVDRYTQSVEEEPRSDNLEDESLSPESAQPLPGSSKMTVTEKSNANLNQVQYEKNCLPSSPKDFTSVQYHNCFSTSPALSNPSVENSHNAFAVDNKMLNTWNPWSTPFFNALDVYASPATLHNSFSNDSSMFMFDNQNMYYARDSCY